MKKEQIHYKYYKPSEVKGQNVDLGNLLVVDKISRNFDLVLNPYFTFYRETILTHLSQEEKNGNYILDYGKVPSLRRLT